MLKPTRTTLALAAGSLVLGLVGAGTAAADEKPVRDASAVQGAAMDDWDRNVMGRVVSKGPLKVRSMASTRSQIVGHVRPNSRVEIACKKYGERVDGNAIWYRLAQRDNNQENSNQENGTPENGTPENGGWQNGGRENVADGPRAYDRERWVSARYVKNLGTVRYCR